MQAQQERFDDNCYELTELRRFRDEYVIVNHPDEVSHYYEVAPQVVSKIDEHKDSANIYQLMYENMVLPAVRLFRSGEVEEAYKVYKAYSDCLESRFVLIDNRLITRNQILEKDSKGGE
jgi:hypothetical protein